MKVVLEYGLDGAMIVRVQSSVSTTPSTDGTFTKTIIVGDDELHKLPALINKILVRSGKSPLSAKEIADSYPVHALQRPAVTFKPEIDIHDYRRAVVKIAYELSHRWLGDRYLEDATAKLMRDIIFDSLFSPEDFDRSELRGQILLGGDLLPKLPMDFSARHLAYMTCKQGQVAICIQIFDIFQALLLVSHNAQDYTTTAEPALLLNARDRTFKESTLRDLLRSLLDEQRGAPLANSRLKQTWPSLRSGPRSLSLLG